MRDDAQAEKVRAATIEDCANVAEKYWAREVASQIRALVAQPPAANGMLALSASERACYNWPDDIELHKKCRAAYVAGATDYAQPPAAPVDQERVAQLQYEAGMYQSLADHWKERHDIVLQKHIECCGQHPGSSAATGDGELMDHAAGLLGNYPCVANALRERAAELYSAVPQTSWRPIETAPETDLAKRDPETVLLWVADGGHGGKGTHAFGRCYKSHDGSIRAVASGFHGNWNITHWSPLSRPHQP